MNELNKKNVQISIPSPSLTITVINASRKKLKKKLKETFTTKSDKKLVRVASKTYLQKQLHTFFPMLFVLPY